MPPATSVAEIMIAVAATRYFNPSSFKKMINVAIQGKDMASTTQATIDCLSVKCSGIKSPAAISFLKKSYDKRKYRLTRQTEDIF